MNELYINIKNRRLQLKMTQTELAKKVGYADKGMISRVENGKIDLSQSQIMKFADALETDPASLMGWMDSATESMYERGLTESLLNAYASRAFWAYHALEIGDKLPKQGIDELISFLDYLASKYNLENIATPEQANENFLYYMGVRS